MNSHRLAIGAAQFGMAYGVANKTGQVPKSEALAMLEVAVENSIDTIDTAIAYGNSESRLGEFCRGYDFKFITKLPAHPKGSIDISGWVIDQVTSSLAKLRVTYLHGLLIHDSGQLRGPEGRQIYQTLQLLKKERLIQKIGVSIYDPVELEKLLETYSLDLVQAPFNIIDRRLLTSGLMHRLKKEGIEIHTRSAFLQGLLLMPREQLPQKFSPWSGLWEQWHYWLENRNVNPVVACLSFPLGYPEIDRVVVGSDNVEQLKEIILSVNEVRAELPDLRCDSTRLINPYLWGEL